MDGQSGWRWCHKCQGIFYAGGPNQRSCPADNQSHDATKSGNYLLPWGDEAQGQQGGWRWCKKCQGMFYSGGSNQGVCSTDHQSHDGSGSGHYAAMWGSDGPGRQTGWRWCLNCQGMFYSLGPNQGACAAGAGQQAGWRWCRKCQGMFFGEGSNQGTCPADKGAHDASMSAHYALILGNDAQGQQGGWLWCQKCQGLFYGTGRPSICPTDHQAHDGSSSGRYAVVWGNGAEGQQAGWRWCQKCQGMFYAEGLDKGVCPADHQGHDASNSGHYAAVIGNANVAHDGSASTNYVMAWYLPRLLHIHDTVIFREGVAVGGWFDLALTSHGDISFSGNFHDSGADSYDMTLTVVLMSPDGLAYSVTHQGRTHGTFDPGSRDDSWVTNERSNVIATNWERFATARWRWNAHAGSLVGKALTDFISDTAKQLAQDLGKAAVGAIVALI